MRSLRMHAVLKLRDVNCSCPVGRLAVANMQTLSCVQCICNAEIVSLGLPINISKGQERNTKAKWISESGAAVPYGMPKEPPFPSYNK